jgi:hypothetical protein
LIKTIACEKEIKNGRNLKSAGQDRSIEPEPLHFEENPGGPTLWGVLNSRMTVARQS